jgi:hypothetical protein
MLAASALAALCMAQGASAELYISPIVRNTVIYNEGESTAPQDRDAEAQTVTGHSSVHGKFLMAGKPAPSAEIVPYGRNVPLFVAVENVVPDIDTWAVHIDKGLENMVVNWRGGGTWQEILETIGEQNALAVVINNDQRAIGISHSEELAPYLAYRIPQVWRMDPALSLGENLDQWVERAGWRLDRTALSIDYPIHHGATFTGELKEVLNEVLGAFANAEVPLQARLYRANRVVRLMEGGYDKEVVN